MSYESGSNRDLMVEHINAIIATMGARAVGDDVQAAGLPAEKSSEEKPPGICRGFAADPTVAALETELQAARAVSLTEPRRGFTSVNSPGARRWNEVSQRLATRVLEIYGIPQDSVIAMPGRKMQLEFNYAGSRVCLSLENYGVKVRSFDGSLSYKEGERLFAEREELREAQYTRAKKPRDVHAQELRDHDLTGDLRDFNVNSMSLGLAVSTALHILQQPAEQAMEIAGPYSATRGSLLAVHPGEFHPNRNPDSARWVVDDDGSVRGGVAEKV